MPLSFPLLTTPYSRLTALRREAGSMVKVGIVGGSGYTGLELLRLLENHPSAQVEWVTSENYTGKALEEYCPAWMERMKLYFQSRDVACDARGVDVVFFALPHGVSMDWVPQVLDHVRVVDLGADFRIKDLEVYRQCYGLEHRAAMCVDEAIYGIPEIYRPGIRTARLVANPGCYPTSILIPLYPLLQAGVIEPVIIADSKSGVSGAGKKAGEATHFCEVDENFKAYKVGVHRHEGEIAEQMSFFYNGLVQLTFVPHLLPVKRGILSTLYLQLKEDLPETSLFDICKESYLHEPWVRVYPPGSFPELKWVVGSNYIDIGLKKTGEGRVVVISALDNLTKGASGQAVQNMNIMFDLDERESLTCSVLYP